MTVLKSIFNMRELMVAIALIAFMNSPVQAKVYFWTNGATGNNNWSDPDNWVEYRNDNFFPTNEIPDGPDDYAYFEGNSPNEAQYVNLDISYTISGIRMDHDALGGDIEDRNVTIYTTNGSFLTLGDIRNLRKTGDGVLIINIDIMGSHHLSVDAGAGNNIREAIVINGNISQSPEGVSNNVTTNFRNHKGPSKTGYGTIRLGGDNSYPLTILHANKKSKVILSSPTALGGPGRTDINPFYVSTKAGSRKVGNRERGTHKIRNEDYFDISILSLEADVIKDGQVRFDNGKHRGIPGRPLTINSNDGERHAIRWTGQMFANEGSALKLDGVDVYVGELYLFEQWINDGAYKAGDPEMRDFLFGDGTLFVNVPEAEVSIELLFILTFFTLLFRRKALA